MQQKAYLINYNTFYLDLFEFKNHHDFSHYMYEFIYVYTKEAFDFTSKHEVWRLYMHNYTVNTSAIYIYPSLEKNVDFSEIYKKSIKEDTRFLIIQIEFMNGTGHLSGSLSDIENYNDEN